MTADTEIVARLRAGDPRVFDDVYDAHHARIFAFLLRLSNRRDTAEDLAQETWARFAKAAKTLREDTTLTAVLFTIARNAFRSHRRWAVLDVSRLAAFGLEGIQNAPSPEVEHERARSIRVLEVALARLSLASREKLLLVGVEGLGQEEAAKILGLSCDATRQRLSRARAELAKRFDAVERTYTSAGKRGELA